MKKNENSRNFGKSRKMEVSRADLTGAPPSSYEGGTPVEACRPGDISPGDISDLQKCIARPSPPTLEPSEEKTDHCAARSASFGALSSGGARPAACARSPFSSHLLSIPGRSGAPTRGDGPRALAALAVAAHVVLGEAALAVVERGDSRAPL